MQNFRQQICLKNQAKKPRLLNMRKFRQITESSSEKFQARDAVSVGLQTNSLLTQTKLSLIMFAKPMSKIQKNSARKVWKLKIQPTETTKLEKHITPTEIFTQTTLQTSIPKNLPQPRRYLRIPKTRIPNRWQANRYIKVVHQKIAIWGPYLGISPSSRLQLASAPNSLSPWKLSMKQQNWGRKTKW